MRAFLRTVSTIAITLSALSVTAVIIAKITNYEGDTGTLFQDSWVTLLLGGILYCLSGDRKEDKE